MDCDILYVSNIYDPWKKVKSQDNFFSSISDQLLRRLDRDTLPVTEKREFFRILMIERKEMEPADNEVKADSIIVRREYYLLNSRFNVIVTSCPTISPPVSTVLLHFKL